MRTNTTIALMLSLLTLSAGNADAGSVIQPADMTGLRSFNGGGTVLLLTFSAVKIVTEDRTIAHFDISEVGEDVSSVTFDIPVENIDPGPPGGEFDVYDFAGDGVVSTDEWAVGALFHEFTGVEGGVQVLTVDVTDLVREYRAFGNDIISFNFRGGDSSDRYWLGYVVAIPDPTLTVVSACPADVNGSGAVDFQDVVAILAAWGNSGGPEDVDGNGTVGFTDLVAVLGAWGECP